MELLSPMKYVTIQRFKTTLGWLCFAPPRCRKVSEGGQSLVEFALMLPFMALLLIGIVEIGRAAFISMLVSHGASSGVEYGSQNTTTASDFTGMMNAATQDSNFAVMTATAINGCACDSGNGASCSNPLPQGGCVDFSCPVGEQVVECVQVTTQANFSPLFHYPGLPRSFQANGNAIMRVRH
jgi:Flp pilus assembly protein TadG